MDISFESALRLAQPSRALARWRRPSEPRILKVRDPVLLSVGDPAQPGTIVTGYLCLILGIPGSQDHDLYVVVKDADYAKTGLRR